MSNFELTSHVFYVNSIQYYKRENLLYSSFLWCDLFQHFNYIKKILTFVNVLEMKGLVEIGKDC